MKYKGLILLIVMLVSLAALLLSGPGGKKYDEIAAVGKPAPALELRDERGSPWKLSDLKGKVVFLNFWATWCTTCKAEAPYKEALSRKMQGKPFQMLGVLFRDDPANLSSYYRMQPFSFPTLISPENEAAKLFGITGVPETFIIDKNGVVREKFVGPREWSSAENIAMLEKYL
ncbi:MAG: TlpA family protein disulfide reductase [Nitrospirae bacterium]|nr:TlpA family protein disulfide reductase [Nitrospirota bacterium]